MSALQIPYEFIEKYVRFSDPQAIRIYLYLRARTESDGHFPDLADAAAALNLTAAQLRYHLDYWISCGEIQTEGDSYTFSGGSRTGQAAPHTHRPIHKAAEPKKPSYTMAEIDAVAAKNKTISGMFYQAETILQKVLTQSDMELLYSFVDWLGLPVEVIVMLLSYAAKRGKCGRRYLEKMAMDWADRGIDTFEAAESYVMELEAYDSAEQKVRRVLGIHDRALTPTEKKYIKSWLGNAAVPLDLLPLAYDRTVAYTGKLSYSYLDSILQDWAKNGVTDAQKVKEYDQKKMGAKAKSGGAKFVKKGPGNNYEDTNPVDYDHLEEQILDLMLDQGES